MTQTIPQRELRNSNAQVIEAVSRGESFVVTRNGEPVADLLPHRARRRRFVSRAEIQALSASGVRIDHVAFRRDLDGAIDQSL